MLSFLLFNDNVCYLSKYNVQTELSIRKYTPPLDAAISRKVVGKTVQATIPKGNMGYDQCTFPDTVAVESTFVAFF